MHGNDGRSLGARWGLTDENMNDMIAKFNDGRLGARWGLTDENTNDIIAKLIEKECQDTMSILLYKLDVKAHIVNYILGSGTIEMVLAEVKEGVDLDFVRHVLSYRKGFFHILKQAVQILNKNKVKVSANKVEGYLTAYESVLKKEGDSLYIDLLDSTYGRILNDFTVLERFAFWVFIGSSSAVAFIGDVGNGIDNRMLNSIWKLA